MTYPPKELKRVMIVVNADKPTVGPALASAFERRGAKTKIFFSHFCNTLYDRLIIHTVNHYAHTLRLVPKSVDLFEGHPKSHREYRNREFLKLCETFAPDLVFLTRGLRFKLATLQQLRDVTSLFCWYIESEKRFREIEPELPLYHHAYFFSTESLGRARQLGFDKVSLLQHAVDTQEFHPMKTPKVYDWCFVGLWNPRRQQYLEGLAKVSKNFAVYGPRWRRRTFRNPTLWLRVKGQGIWGKELTQLYNQTKVAINVSAWGDKHRESRGVNMRLLEVPACGTCLLTDFASDAQLLLTPEQEFVSAASLEEMQEKLAELLADDEKRSHIARQGYEKASRVRTYDDMAAEISRDWAALQDIKSGPSR